MRPASSEPALVGADPSAAAERTECSGPLPSACDCLVVGGGPAGAALAGLLARRGIATVLAAGRRSRIAAPLETLLPAGVRALDLLPFGGAVRRAAVPDRRRHGARWDRDELLWQEDGGPGLLIERPAFERSLRAWAGEQGAHVVAGGEVVELGSFAATGRVRVRFEGDAAGRKLRAGAVAVCAGRRVPARLVPVAVAAAGPGTAAFALRTGDGDATERAVADGVAVVEAVADGWCWWLGDADGRGTAIVVVDADELRRHGRCRLLARALAELRGPARVLAAAGTGTGDGFRIAAAVDATPRAATTAAPVFLVGDAAATVDPLASQGTEKALFAADHAACAIATALRDPALAAAARGCHARWERELWAAHQRTARAFHARVDRFADAPFWRRRSAPEPEPAPLPARLVVRSDLEGAIALVRRGDFLAPEAGVRAAGLEPIARVGRVPIAPLLVAFATPLAPAAAIRAAGADARLFALAPDLVEQAVRELWHRGVLVEPMRQ